MLSYLQSILVIVAGLLVTVLATWIVNRFWQASDRRAYNDVMGWQFGVLGTTYAVILGFMLSSVWTSYMNTSEDVSEEAIANLGVFRSAENLPKPYSDRLRGLATDYASVVLDREWPAMAKEETPKEGDSVIASMWILSLDMLNNLPAQSDAASSVRAAIRLLQDKRERRREQYRSRLPPIMWAVLIGGAILVIASSCLSGNENLRLHYFHVLSITALILLMLTAIADIARPFEGGTSLDPAAFRDAFSRMSKAVDPLSAP
ncbi:MAG: hypothetical protein WBQ95_11520 [Terracidiphilus sp.]